MRVGIAVALCALVVPAAGLAKGPSAATISGPGLAKPLRLGGSPDELRSGSPMTELTMHGGFFQVAWGSQLRRALAKSPTTGLGPKYRVVYVVPGPSGRDDLIRQDLYPHAQGGPATYTPAGQTFFGTRRTHGGWFRAPPRLTTTLVAAGLPLAPSSGTAATVVRDDEGPPATAYSVLLLVLGFAVAAILAVRRRARPASA